MAVGYIRVSTQAQGRSGLGLQAQREAIERFASAQDYTITAWFEEHETGKGFDALDRRPELAKRPRSRAQGEGTGDRLEARLLSRDVAFISKLMSEKVSFIVTELGPS